LTVSPDEPIIEIGDQSLTAPDPKSNSHPLRGYFFIASAAFLWGVSAALGRAVFTGKLALAGEALHPIDPVILSQTRTSFSLLVLLAILIGRSGHQRIKMPGKDLSYCLALGVLGVAASNYFYYVAIQRTSVAIAIILQYTAPVWVLLYVVIRGQQKLSLQKIAAVAVAITGIVLTIGIAGGKSGAAFRLDTFGVIAGLVASFSFAFYNVAGHHVLARYDRWRVLTWTLVAASVFWLAVNPPWKVFAAHYTAAQWTFLLVFSMISVLCAFSLYFLGLQHLEPTRAIITSCLEPVFSILLAAMFLSETVRPVQTLGIILVLAAIVIVQLPRRGIGNEESLVVDPIE
jgi:drug/metabolite transporter (DMT)-like permease